MAREISSLGVWMACVQGQSECKHIIEDDPSNGNGMRSKCPFSRYCSVKCQSRIDQFPHRTEIDKENGEGSDTDC